MNNIGLIIGESGTGKTTSFRNIEHTETFLINVLDKPLSFPKWKEKYTYCTNENPAGNMISTDDSQKIIGIMQRIHTARPEIKTIIIDDFQYIMANEFMRRHSSAGKGNNVFQLYNDIGDHAWNIIMTAKGLRDDLTVIIMSHSEQNESGKTKCKTIGKMLDDKITLEGMFTIVLETKVEDGQYCFITQNNGFNTAKTPMGMFEESLIENDLQLVINRIKEY